MNQILGTDITTIPLQKCFLYLAAIVDLFSRHEHSWTLFNSPDTEISLKAIEMALVASHKSDVLHSDQDCQFTPSTFMARLQVDEV